MKQIVKLPIEPALQSFLQNKQEKINKGEKPPKKWLRSKFKNQIKDKLLPSQKYICCYCEDTITETDCHIDHFYEQSDLEGKKLVYDYQNNLIASCNKNTCCGHYKQEANHERVSVDYDSLLNPINDNSKLLNYNNVGEVEASTKIESEIKQVDYTIQRLNLNGQNPTNGRKSKIIQIKKQIKEEKMNLEEQKKFIASLLNENQAKLPSYYSTIKDKFEFILVSQ